MRTGRFCTWNQLPARSISSAAIRDRILSNLPVLSVPWRGTLDSPMIKSCWAVIISAHFHGAVNLPRSQWTKHAPLFAHVYWLVIRKSTSTPAWLVPMTPSLDSMNEPLRIVLPYCAKRLRTLFVNSPQIHHLCCMLWELKYPRLVANQLPRNPFRSLLLAVSNALWTHSSELLISTD